jgi:hypothetical protein
MEKTCRNIWLLVTSPTTSILPQWTKRWAARSTRSKEMETAGVLKLACGLGSAKALRAQTNGGVLITDGPYLETKEHIGGIYILECADMDEAVAWARKGVAATRGHVEVREIFFMPTTG